VAEQKATKKKIRTVNLFFDSLFPDELRHGPWLLRFWNRMLLEHTWLRLYSPYDEAADNRAVKWVIAMGSLLVFMFINSLVALLMYADNGFCESFITESDCDQAKTAGNFFKACNWRADNESCEFNPPNLDFFTTVVLTLTVALLSVPFDRFWEYCVSNIAQYIRRYQAQHHVTPAARKKRLKRQHDEFCDVQTRQSTMLRAARLDKALHTMDLVTVRDEAKTICQQYRSDEKHRLRHAVFGDIIGQILVQHTRYGSEAKEYQAVKRQLQVSRHHAELIRQEMELLDDPEEQEELLMKHFIIDVFTGHKRRIVSRYFLGDRDVLNRTFLPEYQQMFCLVALPCYAAVMLYFILVLNISIGSRSTNLWLLVILTSFAEDTLLLEPTKIWITWMLINSQVSDEVRSFCESMSMKARLILRRTFGLMRDSNAMVQHFNPACRAARMYPALPISRLLMSVNDRDIPLSPSYDWWGLTYVYFSAGLLALTFLPEVLQESVVELATGTLVNFALMAMAQFGSYSPLIASLTLVLLGLAVIYFVFDGNQYVHRVFAWIKARRQVSPHTLYIDDEDDPVESKSETTEEVYEAAPEVKINRDPSLRAGLFDKHHRVKLKEGQWRVIKHRVTQVRALRGLKEMNRKFKIETALDTEVVDYAPAQDSDSDSDDEPTRTFHAPLEISPRKKAHNEYFAKAKNANLAFPDIESPGGEVGSKALEYISRPKQTL
jgi:hypothetical protein